MPSGTLIYKCRNCATFIENIHVPDIDIALICITNDHPTPQQWGAMTVGKTDLHHCDDNNIGVSDLIGGRYEVCS